MLRYEEYGKLECINEGFPEMTPLQFCWMFGQHMKCEFEIEVTRIEFRYVPGGRLS